MTLFEDIELFTTGKKGQKEFDLPDTELHLIDGFIEKETADNYYINLFHTTTWREYQMELFDSTVTAPRIIDWY